MSFSKPAGEVPPRRQFLTGPATRLSPNKCARIDVLSRKRENLAESAVF